MVNGEGPTSAVAVSNWKTVGLKLNMMWDVGGGKIKLKVTRCEETWRVANSCDNFRTTRMEENLCPDDLYR